LTQEQDTTMNVEPTAVTIDLMASRLEEAARELRHLSTSMRSQGDVGLASEAASVISNLVGNLPLDRLINLSLRAVQHP
jgi:hypothetical protein